MTTHIKKARMALGVCPQFTAIDAHLTVREHLWIYGRLKGVGRKALTDDIDLLVRVTGLAQFKNRLATTLSGGNQRKLALAIALIGEPVLLTSSLYYADCAPRKPSRPVNRRVFIGH